MTDAKLRKRTLAAWKYRCALRPWVRTYGYAHVHHTNYKRYGHEWIWMDLIPLSPGSHSFIHQWLGGAKTVTEQNQRGRYPNLLQRLIHAWCRVTWLFVRFL